LTKAFESGKIKACCRKSGDEKGEKKHLTKEEKCARIKTCRLKRRVPCKLNNMTLKSTKKRTLEAGSCRKAMEGGKI
jgi:hypothetical protein